jgi:hypothetical protein
MIRLPHLTLLIAAATILAGCGESPESALSTSFEDVAQSAARQDDRVSVDELAEWLIEERQDFLLIDVRAADDYQKGWIGDAQNIPLAVLLTKETLSGLPLQRKLVVYSNGAENAAKAAVMLRLAGFNAQLVAGGYNAWHQRILNPDISAEELDGESVQVSAQRAYSCYFVGERGNGAARPNESSEPFVPPVFTETEQENMQPLPPAGSESC